ncbi:hypothetical protein L479_00587 [Exiguobacterium sp. S17]|nr:hypothetical protein L479_00587 [Exiguobacterium sp. S17]
MIYFLSSQEHFILVRKLNQSSFLQCLNFFRRAGSKHVHEAK